MSDCRFPTLAEKFSEVLEKMTTKAILIVEDDRIVAEGIKHSLKRLGYSVSGIVPSGEEALHRVKETRPDLVLMDIRLEGEMDGIEAAALLRSRFNLPAIYLTAYADKETLDRAAKSGPFGYIVKPFDDRDLHTAIEIGLYKYGMEKALRESEERYRILVEQSPFALSLMGADGRYKYVNPRFVEIFGYGLEEMATEEDRKKHGMGKVRHRTHGVTCKDGSKKIIRFSPVSMETGDQLVIYEDVTETQRLEQQLRQTQKMEAIGTMAGGIAHDFNNILSAILGYTDLALQKVDEEGVLKDLREVYRAGIRAKDLIRRILTFSRQTTRERRPIRVKSLAKETLKLLRSSLPATIEIHPGILSDDLVMADPTEIHQVLMNLCTNAGQAMEEEGGILEVGLTRISLDSRFTAMHPDMKPGAFLKLAVRDTGCGIAPETMDRIFDPFFTTKEKGKGTGLGLSVVHGIVKDLGGTIDVYSEPLKGSEFKVYLPVMEGKIQEVHDFSAPLPTGDERILFVDDEAPVRDLSQRLLESLGYHVEVTCNGMEALERFKADPERFDLVITDMTMPRMTGDRLARELMAVRPHIPVILCTGFSARMDENRAKGMGIRAFVLKPLIKSHMAGIIRTVLEGGNKKK